MLSPDCFPLLARVLNSLCGHLSSHLHLFFLLGRLLLLLGLPPAVAAEVAAEAAAGGCGSTRLACADTCLARPLQLFLSETCFCLVWIDWPLLSLLEAGLEVEMELSLVLRFPQLPLEWKEVSLLPKEVSVESILDVPEVEGHSLLVSLAPTLGSPMEALVVVPGNMAVVSASVATSLVATSLVATLLPPMVLVATVETCSHKVQNPMAHFPATSS